MDGRRISVLTEPSFEVSSRMTPIAQRFFPDLARIAVVGSPGEAARFAGIGLIPVVDIGDPFGVDVATEVLKRLGMDSDAVDAWVRRTKIRAAARTRPGLAA